MLESVQKNEEAVLENVQCTGRVCLKVSDIPTLIEKNHMYYEVSLIFVSNDRNMLSSHHLKRQG